MSAPREIPGKTRLAQGRAADPASSAWVAANAGSGKTHVLAQRVVRLLLAGAHPSKILCLTFTKAAAANMSARVFKTLSEWTRLDDRSLSRAIESLGAAAPDSATLVFARRLFARAVETPGGLKIQTIHAFCESLLHRFPFEANAPAGFEVLDEEGLADLITRARRDALRHASCDADLAPYLRTLTAEVSATAFDGILEEALRARSDVTGAAEIGPTVFAARLRDALGLDPDATAQTIECSMVEGLTEPEWQNAVHRLDQSSASDRQQAARLRVALSAGPRAERLACYLEIFLTNAGTPRKRLVTSEFAARHPQLADRLERERERILALLECLKAARTVERTQALLVIVHAILKRYRTLKIDRGLLDFDDLIERAAFLLEESSAAWVLYKLDAGIDHVLVDEAQDTSQTQWGILRALVEEFTAGRGARSSERTIFAVGDEKQSIYSFQGAAPHLFETMRRFFAARHRDAEKRFEPVDLTLSFRSSNAVLRAVDTVFSRPEARRGLYADDAVGRPHEAWKTDLPGLVELWDPLRPTERVNPRDWRLPVDSLASSDPETILAHRIADRIAAWLAPGSDELVHDEGGPRRIRKGDILILVRKRGPLFEAIIRALKEQALAVTAADRLILAEHICVMDLVAAGRTALLPQDDFTLACVLKSPLIGLDDDDLLTLAPRRPGSLYAALQDSPQDRHRQAARRIAAWRARMADSPFNFYARLLGAEGGRRALIARLGPEASDAIDEFMRLALDHERHGGPSLMNFLHRMEASQVCVKRDMDAAGEAIRVMTAHAAKGLEAKIVILPDTCSAPSGHHDPKLYFLEAVQGPLPVYNPRRSDEPACLARTREAARLRQEEEHRRLLYVAMTRAEERLYIAGVEGQRGRARGCWYELIETGLEPLLSADTAPWSPQERVRRMQHAWPPGAPSRAEAEPAPDSSKAPRWLERPVPQEPPPPALRPSRARATNTEMGPANPESRKAARRGELAHMLLQRLPRRDPDVRFEAAMRWLESQAPDLSQEERRSLAEQAMATLRDPRLAHLFGRRSRAEVPIRGRVRLPGGGEVEVVGVLDRLAETEEAIWIADFKTGQLPRGAPLNAYLAQLALYREVAAALWPDRALRACLVFTEGPHVVEPSAEALAAALRELV